MTNSTVRGQGLQDTPLFVSCINTLCHCYSILGTTPPIVPVVSSSWTEMCFEDFSLDSGEDSDDDDNIAYRTLLVKN